MSEEIPDRKFLLDWQAAEAAAVRHMKTIGFLDAHITAGGADGGIDAESVDAVAQVKFYASPVGRPEIQRLKGAAHQYRLALFYSTGGYTREALSYATDADIALFAMNPYGDCESTSPLAAALVEPDLVQERNSRMQELEAARYSYAATSVQLDLGTLDRFIKEATLSREEMGVCSHIRATLGTSLGEYRAAIQSRDFVNASGIFEKVLGMTAMVSCIAGPDLGMSYENLDQAVSEGWVRDTSTGSEFPIRQIAVGIAELQTLLNSSLQGYGDGIPETKTEDLVDVETGRFVTILLLHTENPTLLTPILTQQLKDALRAGIVRTREDAQIAFNAVVRMFGRIHWELPPFFVAQRIRADAITAQLLAQLDTGVNP
jgi:hypothetical protein